LLPTNCARTQPSDYKHVAEGLIFLKHISNAFEAKRAALLAEDPATAEDLDEYLAENVLLRSLSPMIGANYIDTIQG
jgi:type I restriction-modification system DNA methylase subunit